MKTCKKILASVLVLTLLSTMMAGTFISVSADPISNVEVASSEENVIALWDAEYAAKDLTKIKAKGSGGVATNLSSDTVTVGSDLYLANAAEAGATMTRDTTIEEGNTVFNVTSDLFQNNYRLLVKEPANNGDDVLAFSSRLQIPSKQPDGITKTDVTRTWSLPMVIKGGDTYSGSTKYLDLSTVVTFKYDDNGNLVASASVDNTNSKTNIPMVVAEDQWIDVDIHWFLVDGKLPFIAIYVNNKMIYSASAIGGYIYNKSVTTSTTDETTGEVTETTTKYYPSFDLIKFEAKTDKLATTYLDEFKLTSHKIKTLPILSVATTASSEITGSKKEEVTIYGSTGVWKKAFVQSGTSSTTDAVYTKDTETVADETVINVQQAGNGLTRMVSNVREPITEYIDTTDPVFLEAGLDIYVPEGMQDNITREYLLRTVSSVRGTDESNYTIFKRDGLSMRALLRGGMLTVDSYESGEASGYIPTKFFEKSETVDVSTSQWVNVKIVSEITGAEETGYTVKVYGILDNTNLIYTAEWAYPAGEFGVDQIVIDLENNASAVADTKIDNVNIALHSDYTIPEKTWNLTDFAYPVQLTQDGTKVVVEGLILNLTSSADLVVAFYDANGKLIAPITKKTLTNTSAADFEINESVEIPSGAVKAKAFLFKELSSARALAEHDVLTIVTE